MKKLYLNPMAKFLSVLAFIGFSYHLKAQTVTTFSFTGNVQTFTVPPCVGSISVDLSGAQGATAPNYFSIGGLGGRIVAVIPVTAGQVFSVYVGGQNGYNGGGNGATNAGTGGGATDIRTGGSAFANRVLVAGGGGGGGTNCGGTNNPGGSGGGTVGVTGWQCGAQTSWVGTGGSQTAGGISTGGLGSAGALGVGGNGGANWGGGGGGGYYGGGGASYGGGGGGSSFAVATASNVVHTQGFRSGNGIATFSYSQNGSGVTVSPTTGTLCSGANATLTAGSVVSYTWSANAGGGNLNTVTVSPTANTVYSVSGTNTFGCITTATVNLAVNATTPNLVIANTGSNNICPGVSATLTASGANSYSWSGSITNGVGFVPSSSNSYTITGTNACGSSTAVASISINSVPTVTIANSSPTICSGNTATLTATGASSYIWVGPTTVTNGLAFFPTTTGNYTVIATAANNCTTSAITSISVTTTPGNFATSTPSAICFGGTATISTSGATNYTWFPGGSNSNSIVVNPTITTTYTVVKSNANCVDTKTYTLTVNSLPSLLLLASQTTICAINQLTLTGGGANTYTWFPPGITGASVIVTPSASTIYTLRGSNGTCANTETVSITTLANPTITIVPSTSVICNGFCTTLTVGGAVTYSLNTNPLSGTAVLSGTEAVDCPTTTTSYSISGTNSLGCTTGASRIVLVNPNPVFTPTANPPIVCVAGTSTVGIPAMAGTSYSWSTGASTRTNQISPLTNSMYSLTVTFTATQCKTTNTVSVGVFIPTFAITGPTAVCAGGTITLNSSGSSIPNNGYVWIGGGYTSTGFPSFAVSPTVPSVYVCTGTGTQGTVTCSSTNTVLINIYQNPTITAVVDRTLSCKNETIFLTGGGGATYTWSSNQSGSVVPVTPQENIIVYTVTGTDANGCLGTATVQVRRSFCTGIDEETLLNKGILVYPNPSNGEFTIEGDAEMDLRIIDGLGREVKAITIKQSNSLSTKVDGLAPGVYFITGERNGLKINQKIIINK